MMKQEAKVQWTFAASAFFYLAVVLLCFNCFLGFIVYKQRSRLDAYGDITTQQLALIQDTIKLLAKEVERNKIHEQRNECIQRAFTIYPQEFAQFSNRYVECLSQHRSAMKALQ